MARTSLGAQRINAGYLAALRVVLANQSRAERYGYDLEMNLDTPFATERTMRTIIDQMATAGHSQGKQVNFGGGRRQTIQCFAGAKSRPRGARAVEGETAYVADLPHGLLDSDVPTWPVP